LEQPLKRLIQNSSVYNKSKLLGDIADDTNPSVGFNAESEKIEDLAAAGVLDSAKALKEALTLALAHAKGILTTGAWDAASKGGPDSQKDQ
jgi:chaperonin GroEL